MEHDLVALWNFEITGSDRAIHTAVVQASEPVAGEPPSDLAAVAGRLFRHPSIRGPNENRR